MQPSLQEKSALKLSDILRPIWPKLNSVEERLLAVADESEGVLREASHYVLQSGGKRLRAALVLFCASIGLESGKSSTNEESDPYARAESVAVAVELIHAATLVHDDIIDRAVIRRLKPTVNMHFGEDVAVLLGDFLYARAFEMLASLNSPQLLKIFSRTTQEMCEGEISQLKNRFKTSITLAEYFSFIQKKTASLIGSSAEAGGLLGELAQMQVEDLKAFGNGVGMAFQMIDDLLDVVGTEDRMGKTLRADLGNGKMTLPLFLLMDHLTPDEKLTFTRSFESMSLDWKWLGTLIEKYNLSKKTEDYARNYFYQAISHLNSLPPAAQESLTALSKFILKRDY